MQGVISCIPSHSVCHKAFTPPKTRLIFFKYLLQSRGQREKSDFGFNVQRAAPTKPLWAFQTFNLQDAGMGTQSENNSVLGLNVQEQRFLQKTFAEFVSKTAANLEMGGLGLLFHFLKGLEIHLLKPYTGQNSRREKSLCSLTSQTEGRWGGHLKDLAG